MIVLAVLRGQVRRHQAPQPERHEHSLWKAPLQALFGRHNAKSIHVCFGGASGAGASSIFPGRSITTDHLDITLPDMLSACVLLSAWQLQCQEHA